MARLPHGARRDTAYPVVFVIGYGLFRGTILQGIHHGTCHAVLSWEHLFPWYMPVDAAWNAPWDTQWGERAISSYMATLYMGPLGLYGVRYGIAHEAHHEIITACHGLFRELCHES